MKIACFSFKDGINILSKKFEHPEPWRFTQCRWTKGIYIRVGNIRVGNIRVGNIRVGKTGSLGPWSRVIVYCMKVSFCPNDSPIAHENLHVH